MVGIVADRQFAAGAESVLDGGSFALLGRPALSAGATLTWSFVVTLVIAYALRALLGLRVTQEQEVTGIDTTVHAESAYELGSIGAAGPSVLPPAATAAGARPSSVEVH